MKSERASTSFDCSMLTSKAAAMTMKQWARNIKIAWYHNKEDNELSEKTWLIYSFLFRLFPPPFTSY